MIHRPKVLAVIACLSIWLPVCGQSWRPDNKWVSLKIDADDTTLTSSNRALNRMVQSDADLSEALKKGMYAQRSQHLSLREAFTWLGLEYAVCKREDRIFPSGSLESALKLVQAKYSRPIRELYRLRWLVQKEFYNSFDLIPGGRQLLALDPNDFEVIRGVANLLKLSKKKQEVDEAVRLAERGLSTDKSWRAGILLADTLFFRFRMTGDRADGKKSLDLFVSNRPKMTGHQFRRKIVDDTIKRLKAKLN